MMFFCPVCGRRRFVHQPQFWPYRFDGEMFCSENCWICDSTRKIMERKGFRMARMKKDGTPAKKPGPRAKKKEIPEQMPAVKLTGPIRIETPEASMVEVVETPEKPVDMSNQTGYRICGLEGEFGRFFYDKKFDRLDWTTPEGDEVSMDPLHWRLFVKQMPRIMDTLIVEAGKK